MCSLIASMVIIILIFFESSCSCQPLFYNFRMCPSNYWNGLSMYDNLGIDVIGPRMCQRKIQSSGKCMYKTLYGICNHIARDILDIEMDAEESV